MLKKTASIGFILMVILYAVPAAAANAWSCFVATNVLSRALPTNMGAFPTRGAVADTVAECSHESGFYIQPWTRVPFLDFTKGREVDLRIGYRGAFGDSGFKYDASTALYVYGTGPGPVTKNVNFRGVVSYPMKFGDLSVTPSFGADLQFIVAPNLFTDHSIFAGVGFGFDFSSRLHGSLDLAVWRHLKTPYKGFNETVLSAKANLLYDFTPNFSAGPMMIATHGGFDAPHKTKIVGGLTALYKF